MSSITKDSSTTNTMTKPTHALINAQTKVIVIDGLIGAGKSTFVVALDSYLRNQINPSTKRTYTVVSCLEPVQLWTDVGILKLFYQDPVRYAYSFQTYTYVTRIQSILSELDKAKAHYSQPVDFLLLERSILTDRYVFMRLLEPSLEPALVKMYATWFDMYQHLLPFDLQNAKFVYLQTSPEESMARMNKRGRPEEILDAKHSNKEEKQGGVSLTYQHQLHQAHLEFYKKQLKTTWMINSGLCAQDFSSPQSKGFQEILGSLRPLLAIAGYEEKEKEADTNGRSCQTVFGRVC